MTPTSRIVSMPRLVFSQEKAVHCAALICRDLDRQAVWPSHVVLLFGSASSMRENPISDKRNSRRRRAVVTRPSSKPEGRSGDGDLRNQPRRARIRPAERNNGEGLDMAVLGAERPADAGVHRPARRPPHRPGCCRSAETVPTLAKHSRTRNSTALNSRRTTTNWTKIATARRPAVRPASLIARGPHQGAHFDRNRQNTEEKGGEEQLDAQDDGGEAGDHRARASIGSAKGPKSADAQTLTA